MAPNLEYSAQVTWANFMVLSWCFFGTANGHYPHSLYGKEKLGHFVR